MLVYYATISCNDKTYKPKLYKGSCETSFKKHYSNHKKSFNVLLYKHDTKLSTEYWNLKMKQLNPQISWKIKGIYKSYNPTSKGCNLCLTEKLKILEDPDKILLNKRSEIISHKEIYMKLSEYLKLGCVFTIIQLYVYVYIYIYIYYVSCSMFSV